MANDPILIQSSMASTQAAAGPFTQAAAGPSSMPAARRFSSHHRLLSSPLSFDIIGAYKRALEDEQVPHPIAAIAAILELMDASSAATLAGLSHEIQAGRELLIGTQPWLGVRAGCQLWDRFFSAQKVDSGADVQHFKRNLIRQGRTFCQVTALQCREKIADMAVGFLKDDATILTHSSSRTVLLALQKAHRQNKRIKVYVAEGRPQCLGLRTHAELTAAGIPCEVVLDSAVAYIMERVDLVMVGSEAVFESGALVSSVGSYQVALVAKALSVPFYALAESYKFLRHYPLSQTDLPQPKLSKIYPEVIPLAFASTPGARGGQASAGRKSLENTEAAQQAPAAPEKREMTKEMIDNNPLFDITTPDLIDFIFTDLGAPLAPTSVSQYLVAQFAE